MAEKSDAKTTRLYVQNDVNDRIDMAHIRVMAHCNRRIAKTDFIAKVLEVGLENEPALYEAYSDTDSIAS